MRRKQDAIWEMFTQSSHAKRIFQYCINEFIIPKLNPLESASSSFHIRLCVPACECVMNREFTREVL